MQKTSPAVAWRTLRNRVKFFVLADVIEFGNRFIPSQPHQLLIDTVCKEPVTRALDLATGTGYTAGLLANALPTADIHGIDLSADMLRVGRRSLARRGLRNVTLHEGDASARLLGAGGRFAYVDLDRPARFSGALDAYLSMFEPAHAKGVLGNGVTGRLGEFGLDVASRKAVLGGVLQLVVARKRGAKG